MFAEETKEVTLYSYNTQGVFTGEFQYLWVVGTGLASNSTLEKPLKDKDGFVSVWNGSAWEYQENHLGKTIYSTETKESKTVDYVGEIQQGWTPLKPIEFGEWNGSEWIDTRTAEEIAAYNRSLLQKLSKRQFALYLYDHDMYDQVMQAIEANPRFKIEYDSVSDIERLSPTVASMTALLGWTDDQVDQMWEQAIEDIVLYAPIAWPSTTIPSGHLAMMGQTISQAQYPKLYALYGSKLPDMRAHSIKGLDYGRGIDSGRSILTEQGDAIRNITGTFGNIFGGSLS